ncbi:MAG: hypothetical protein MUC62_03675 [Candidatus Thermoplasmatota archaeon]|jgi:hypothetical protein|nr:hypothetical protein [Candidatus Thermoplasmatota archaeon]
MGANPDICPNCSERNGFNLDYCAVCGLRFHARKAIPRSAGPGSPNASRKKVDPETLKIMKKKRTLLTAFREGRISEEKLRTGLRDLGGSEEVERALDLKKFLEEQIKTFEQMDLSGQRGGDFPDPDTPQTDLPRDENGAPITDFRASAEDRDFVTKGRPFETRSGASGASLFERSRPDGRGPRKVETVGAAAPRFMTEEAQANANRRTVRSSGVNWDEDEEEDVEEEDWGEEEEDEEDFEIDLGTVRSMDIIPEKKPSKKNTVEWLNDDEDDGWGTERARKRRDLRYS